MSRHSISLRTTAAGAGVACLEICRPTSATKFRPVLVELGIAIAAATESTFGLGRAAVVGVTPTSPQNLLPEEGDPTTVVYAALAWGTGPTVPANFFRRADLGAVIGNWVNWKFENGLYIGQAGSSLVLWNISAVAAADVYAVIEE